MQFLEDTRTTTNASKGGCSRLGVCTMQIKKMNMQDVAGRYIIMNMVRQIGMIQERRSDGQRTQVEINHES